tara:strand:+ start:240 stop:620 length:381 start_codon:yes stop_codon:yes gene_type:complete
MPRLPVDGKKVIEHRITLGTKEREIFEHISTSIRINSIDTAVLSNIMTDPGKIIQIMYSVATIAEIAGIETGLPTVADLPEVIAYLRELASSREFKVASETSLEFLDRFPIFGPLFEFTRGYDYGG